MCELIHQMIITKCQPTICLWSTISGHRNEYEWMNELASVGERDHENEIHHWTLNA